MAGTIARIGSARLPDGAEAEEFVLDDGRGMAARIGSYGARLLSLRVPDRHGAPVEVALGHDRLEDWASDGAFMGATIGRCANRIAGGRFELDGQTHQVPTNKPPNALHGGPGGFDKAVWRMEPPEGGAALAFAHVSPDGDQGFPGALRARVRYALTGDGVLSLRYEAEADRPTVVNLTNHTYFNLAGAGSDVLDHVVTIAADRFTPVDAALIPTGELRPVAGTPFDFRAPARIGARVDEPGDEQLRFAGGYDHNFVLRPPPPGGQALRLAARVEEPARGLSMEVWTTEPALQFYTGNSLDGSRPGRGGVVLGRRSGLCLETQHFPDSPNRPEFPSVVLRPGETFRSSTLYRFAAGP
ncbi:galactose mutarotase [Craurococcus roseus]|uniref:Aldose 1-epimerase n=1 Tax=Craurococcus roseus TaxID=77585 RepID=A0ABN1F5R6_9PROT